MFVQQLVRINVKWDIKTPHHWPFVKEISQKSASYKVPIIRKACHRANLIVITVADKKLIPRLSLVSSNTNRNIRGLEPNY